MADTRRITMELKEQIAVLAERTNGWTKELNLVSWNGNPPKYDIRDWDQEHARVSKGLTLFDDEMRRLVDGYLRYRNRKVVESGDPYREPMAVVVTPEVEDAGMHEMQQARACAERPMMQTDDTAVVDAFEEPAGAEG